jgi:hypothetical protein
MSIYALTAVRRIARAAPGAKGTTALMFSTGSIERDRDAFMPDLAPATAIVVATRISTVFWMVSGLVVFFTF